MRSCSVVADMTEWSRIANENEHCLVFEIPVQKTCAVLLRIVFKNRLRYLQKSARESLLFLLNRLVSIFECIFIFDRFIDYYLLFD